MSRHINRALFHQADAIRHLLDGIEGSTGRGFRESYVEALRDYLLAHGQDQQSMTVCRTSARCRAKLLQVLEIDPAGYGRL